MKKNILLTLVFLLAIAFTSCKKPKVDDPEPQPEPQPVEVIGTVVTLNGSNEMTVSLQGTFTDPGATANDSKDGAISPIATGSVNINMKGVYEITYTATNAAGDSASATRKVHVVNDADALNGNYAVVSQYSSGSGPFTYSQTITASTTMNNRIIFSRFGDYAGNTAIYADIIGSSSIDIPSQMGMMVGNPPANRSFQGTGNKSGNALTLTFMEVTNGYGATFQEVMTKL